MCDAKCRLTLVAMMLACSERKSSFLIHIDDFKFPSPLLLRVDYQILLSVPLKMFKPSLGVFEKS